MSVLSFLQNSSAVNLGAALADEVQFQAPAGEYAGREEVVHLLTAISVLLEILAITWTVREDATTTTLFTARVDGHDLDFLLDERLDAQGRIAEVRLLPDPSAALEGAMHELRSELTRDRMRSFAEDWLARTHAVSARSEQ